MRGEKVRGERLYDKATILRENGTRDQRRGGMRVQRSSCGGTGRPRNIVNFKRGKIGKRLGSVLASCLWGCGLWRPLCLTLFLQPFVSLAPPPNSGF